MLASTDPNKPTRKVEWRWPMARDNSGYPPAIISFPRDIISPYAFPIGTTRIKYTARDRSGNSQSCVFTVIIIGRNTYTWFITWHKTANFLYEMRLQRIMVSNMITHYKMTNTTTMIPCRYISKRESGICKALLVQFRVEPP